MLCGSIQCHASAPQHVNTWITHCNDRIIPHFYRLLMRETQEERDSEKVGAALGRTLPAPRLAPQPASIASVRSGEALVGAAAVQRRH